jgi:hypothetical protein
LNLVLFFQVVEGVQAIPGAVADAANAVGEKIAAAGHWVTLFRRQRFI